MVFVPEEKLKRKMEMDGSVLKFMHSVGGAGKGILTMGGMIAVIGLMLAAALAGTMGTESAVKVGAAMVLPGILLMVLGISLHKKKLAGYLRTYEKATHLTQEQLAQLEEEFKQPGTVLMAMDNAKDTNSLKKMGFITAHYVKFPGIDPSIFPLQEMVACFYTKRYLCQDGGYDRALIAYASDGDLVYYYNSPPEKESLEIVSALETHNPLIITDHHFTYEGKEYDAVRESDEVIALSRRMRSTE